MFRGSANTGFRAPTLFDRYGYRTTVANTTTAGRWDDPVLCPGPTPAIPGTGTAVAGFNAADVCNAKLNKLTGSNNALQPERSKGGTLGVVFEPNPHVHGIVRLLAGQHEGHAGQPAGKRLLHELRGLQEPVRA